MIKKGNGKPLIGRATTKPRSKRTQTKVGTITTTVHPDGRSSVAGHEERLAAFVKRTLELKRAGHYLYEIAQIIADEYSLSTVPCISTIAKWSRVGMDAFNEDIKELQTQLRLDQLHDIQQLKAKWMPIATAGSLAIRRWKLVEGTAQPEIDENAVKEQMEATKTVVSLMAQEMKLMGLNLEKAVTTSGEGPESLQELQLWLIGRLSEQAQGSSSAGESEILELKSGLPEPEDEDHEEPLTAQHAV